jgi:hypothetical protein
MYSSDSLYLGERQSVPSSTRSSSEQLSQNVPRVKPITSREVSQSTSLNPSIFDTSETSQLSASPASSTSLSSEPSEFKSAENVVATRVACGEPDMPAIWGQLQAPCPFPSRLLQPKERQSAKTVLINKLISQLICSFPERMNRASSPPFIHQSTFLRSMNTMPTEDPIVVCQDINRKFTAREAHGDIPIWDAIALEQERIYDRRASFSEWILLSSTQTITIYLLMLTAEHENVLTHHPSLPITLLFTLGALFEQLHQIHPGYVAAKEQSGSKPSWEDWIFAESKLRTANVYFILALHFNLDFGLPCEREGFEDVELPAGKILWEAKNELSWHEEFDLTVPPRLKYRDLVRQSKRECGYECPDIQKDEPGRIDRIEKWHKEIDEFSMLVALCSTMV